jgi:membrane associated rhomboid family serine protease
LKGLATAALLIALGALVAVLYPYALFFAGERTQWLTVRATLAALAILVGAFISSAGIAIIALRRAHRLAAEDTGEGEEGR